MSLILSARLRLYVKIWVTNDWQDRFQWPRSLRRGSAVACLLGLRVLIPPVHGCMFLFSVVCCQVEISATSWSLVQRSPTDCDVSVVSVVCFRVEISATSWSLVQRIPTWCGFSECDHESLTMRRPLPTGGCCATVKKKRIFKKTNKSKLLSKRHQT